MPFDYGFFAFIADRDQLKERGLKAPESLDDLLKPEWKRNVILEDPRTSTPGLAFVQYVQAVKLSQAKDFWKKMRSQWLTLAAGWDAAYGIFLKKEAPLVWSYTTSQAYHAEHGDSAGRYQALMLKEGLPQQIEGAFALKAALEGASEKTRDCARAFLEYLVSKDAQEQVPPKNWMYPVNSKVELSKSFGLVPKPKRVIELPAKRAEVEGALTVWSEGIR